MNNVEGASWNDQLSWDSETQQSCAKQSADSFRNDETEKFTKIIDQYIDIKELDSEIINELIDKVLVHHKEEIDGNTYQQVEIYYKFVGNLDRTAKNAA